MLSTRTKQVNAYGKRGKRVVDVTVSGAKSVAGDIISIFDDLPPPPALTGLTSRMKGRENGTPKKPKVTAPKAVGAQRKKRLSPVLSPAKKPVRVSQFLKESSNPLGDLTDKKAKVKAMTIGRKGDAAVDSPVRAPLSSFPVNVLGSPSLPSGARVMKQRVPSTKGPSKLGKPTSPVVNMDIIVLDDEGRTISTERRVSRTGVAANPINKAPKPVAKPAKPSKSKVPIYVDSASESEAISQPTQEKLKLRKRGTKIVLSDDSVSEDDLPPPQPKAAKSNVNVKPAPGKATASKLLQKAGPVAEVKPNKPQPLRRATTVEVLIPPAPYATAKVPRMSALPALARPSTPPKLKAPIMQTRVPAFQLPASPIFKGRQLTPIRGGRSKGLFEQPSPPSPSYSDLDLSLDFSELSLDADDISGSSFIEPSFPEHLRPLLEECHQEDIGPHDFSSFIESFPFDPILQQARERKDGELSFRKIGEASYSEVFGIGNVVLKVIPLRDETPRLIPAGGQRSFKLAARGAPVKEDLEYDGPPPSDAQDVRKEIIVTRAMGEVHRGFVKLLKTYVVKGKYPEALLNLWDEYYEEKGSESIRPDTFSLSQAYAIIVLPNGGPDLEAYTFSSPLKSGWRQASSIFWQVAKSLAHSEHLVSFEHRDLHWGQILVRNVPSQKPKLKTINMNSGSKSRSHKRAPMDDQDHGVEVTIIDLGLSRMDAGDGSNGTKVQWTPIDDEVFMGEGDYQFDVYRMMRDHSGGEWEGYHPLTNVMWLHYLATKLLRAKGLKPPTTARKGKGASEGAPVATEASGFSEKECYEALLEVEQWLGQTLIEAFPARAKATAAAAKGRGRPRATLVAPIMPLARNDGPVCAGEIVEYGSKRGWVRAGRLF